MSIRLEVQTLHNVRPRKGEASFNGRLLKSFVVGADTVETARDELRGYREAGLEIHAAYIRDAATFKAEVAAWRTSEPFRPSSIEAHDAATIASL